MAVATPYTRAPCRRIIPSSIVKPEQDLTVRELTSLLSPILAVLLVVLSPIGTGQGVHRDQLLDPLFPHVHFGSGPTAMQTAALQTYQRVFGSRQPDGPALGAGAGAATSALEVGVTPPVPGGTAGMPVPQLLWRLEFIDLLPRGAPVEAPPDPPPTNT